jgi:hypothetical protein
MRLFTDKPVDNFNDTLVYASKRSNAEKVANDAYCEPTPSAYEYKMINQS